MRISCTHKHMSRTHKHMSRTHMRISCTHKHVCNLKETWKRRPWAICANSYTHVTNSYAWHCYIHKPFRRQNSHIKTTTLCVCEFVTYIWVRDLRIWRQNGPMKSSTVCEYEFVRCLWVRESCMVRDMCMWRQNSPTKGPTCSYTCAHSQEHLSPSKEPCIPAKEPCIPAKEPYIKWPKSPVKKP